jgi:hypothetical protein
MTKQRRRVVGGFCGLIVHSEVTIPLLRITGYDQAMRLFASEWPTHVISVLVGAVPRYCQKHLHVRFDDIVRPQSGLIPSGA